MDAPPPPPGQPDKPPTKGGFKGRKSTKRGLSRNPKKGSKNQKGDYRSNKSEDVPPVADPQERPAPSAATVYTKTSKAEYAQMYHSCKAQLDACLAESNKKDVLIAKLQQKIEQLIKTSKSSRDKAKEAQKHASKVEKEAETATKRLQLSLEDTYEQLQKKDTEWQEVVARSVDEVREVERVSIHCLYYSHALFITSTSFPILIIPRIVVTEQLICYRRSLLGLSRGRRLSMNPL